VLLVKVDFEIGVVLGDEQLVVDVAVVEELLVATLAVSLVLIVLPVTHAALPLARWLLLVSHAVLPLVVGGLSRILLSFSSHCSFTF
jgi:hypothetical protein